MLWGIPILLRDRAAAGRWGALLFVFGLTASCWTDSAALAVCTQIGSTVSCTGTTTNYNAGTQTNLNITVQSGATVQGFDPSDAIRIQNSSGITGNTLVNYGTIDGFVTILSVNPGTDSFTNHGVLKITDPNSPLQQHSMAGASFIQSSSGILMVRVDSNGFNDGIFSRTATLAGRFVAVIQSGLYTSPITYNGVIDTSAGFTGAFTSVTSSSPFFSTSLATVGNDLDLTITRIPFNAVPGSTPNQRSIGNVLEAAYATTPTGDAATLFSNLFAASSLNALDQLSGAGTTAAQDASFNASGLFSGAMQQQGLGWLNGTPGGNTVTFNALGYAGQSKTETSRKPGHEAFAAMHRPDVMQSRWRLWGAGFGGTRTTDGQVSAGSADQSTNVFGGAFGADHQVSADLLLGFAFGGSRSHFAVDSLTTSGNADAAHLGIYAAHRFGAAYFTSTLNYVRTDTSTERTITGIGPTEFAKDRFTGDQIGGRFELGRKYRQFDYNLTPFAAIEPAALWQHAYTETSTTSGGAPGVLGLSYGNNRVTSLPAFLGARVDTQTRLKSGQTWTPSVQLAWMHEFRPERSIQASFLSLPGTNFSAEGARPSANAVRMDAGGTLTLGEAAALFANFSSELSGRSRSFAGLAGARVNW